MDSNTKKAELVEFYRQEISRRSPPKNHEDHFMISGYKTLIDEMIKSMGAEQEQLSS